MSTANVFDLVDLYKTYFIDKPYFVDDKNSQQTVSETAGYVITDKNPNPKGTIFYSKHNIAFNKIGSYGQNIWFPVSFASWKTENGISVPLDIEIEACTIGVQLNKNIIKTAVRDRKRTVKECFNIDDYKFTIRGFLIGKNRQFPEEQINTLRDIFETDQLVQMYGGYPELFLDKFCSVTVESLDFPEVQGKAVWIRPFNMVCLSNFLTAVEFDQLNQ